MTGLQIQALARRGRRSAHRQKYVNRRAGALDFVVARAFHPYLAAVRFDHAFGDRQAEARAAALEFSAAAGVAQRVGRAVELLKDALAILGRDADAVVGDGDLDDRLAAAARTEKPRFDAHVSAVGRVFDAVADNMYKRVV